MWLADHTTQYAPLDALLERSHLQSQRALSPAKSFCPGSWKRVLCTGKCKSFNSPNIRVGRFQPLLVVYIEVSEIEKFCLRVIGCHGLMARVKRVKESYKVCRIGRTVSETEKDSDGRETNLILSQMTSNIGDSRSTRLQQAC